MLNLIEAPFASPEETLAADEVLLDLCEADPGFETLRFWVPDRFFVVVGYGNQVEAEVDTGFCQTAGIPVLRRPSGGGTVLQGPGCLNYCLTLRFDPTGPLCSISAANRWIMERNRAALQAVLGQPVEVQGHTDLTVGGRKFSGNAQRRLKHALLFHGSLLLDMDLDLIAKTLRMPSRQPAYRNHRPHTEFVTNLHVPGSAIREALVQAWDAIPFQGALPRERVQALAREKYSTPAWNRRF